MDKQSENMVREILVAIEKGTKEGDDKIIAKTTLPDFRKVLLSTGKMYAGCIGMAICEVLKKYTETKEGEG